MSVTSGEFNPGDITPPNNDNIMILQPVRAEDVGRRGRPRTKVSVSDVKTPDQVYSATTSRPNVPRSGGNRGSSEDDVRKKAAAKKREIDELQTKIVTELNEQILEAFVALGLAPEMLFKSGAPKNSIIDSNYTELAREFCVTPMQARLMAHGWVDAKELPALQKYLQPTSSGPSYLWVGLGVVGLGSYILSMAKAFKQLSEISKKLSNIQETAEEVKKGPSFPEA